MDSRLRGNDVGFEFSLAESLDFCTFNSSSNVLLLHGRYYNARVMNT